MRQEVRRADFWNGCPSCEVNLREEWKDRDGSVIVGTRLIGVEIRGLYDGTAYWMCPDCHVVWHRWADTPGNGWIRHSIEELWRDQGLTIWRGSM